MEDEAGAPHRGVVTGGVVMGLSRSERVVLCLLSAAILVGRLARDRLDRSGEGILLSGAGADSASAGGASLGAAPDTGAAPASVGGAARDTASSARLVAWPLDLNAAGEADLVHLPGIGPAKARAILERRAREGPYMRVEELLDVPGIGPKTLARLRDLVVVKSPERASGGRP
jgi:competence protein ComEA